jgi:hypothetical protein
MLEIQKAGSGGESKKESLMTGVSASQTKRKPQCEKTQNCDQRNAMLDKPKNSQRPVSEVC